jgi:hypothetical protein
MKMNLTRNVKNVRGQPRRFVKVGSIVRDGFEGGYARRTMSPTLRSGPIPYRFAAPAANLIVKGDPSEQTKQ